MKRITLFLFFLLSQLITAQKTVDLSELKAEIDSIFLATQGEFAIAFKNISNGDEILINEKKEFHAASTMKTPVMIEIFKRLEADKLNLNDSLLIKNEFKSIVSGKPFSLDVNTDSGDSLYVKIGSKVSIKDLMVDMIIHSSNLATNTLIEVLDAKKITQTMRDLGAKDIMVLRGVEDIEAYDAGLSNTTTAFDLMLIFEKLAKGEAVSKEADARMKEILLRQRHNDMIPAKLPPGIKVAHKTGSITGLRHDSGIVILPNGDQYVLVLLSSDMDEPEEGTEMLSNISRMIFDHVSQY